MTLLTDSGTAPLDERRALTLLAASMFAEARELGGETDLGARLAGYCETLMHCGSASGSASEAPYVINPPADGPALRRLATLMDALAMALGPRSAVARLLSQWSARIFAAVAASQQDARVLEAPSDELLAIVTALGSDADHDLNRRLGRTVARHPLPAAPPALEATGRVAARVWTRRTTT